MMDTVVKSEKIVNQILGKDGVLYFEVVWKNSWISFQQALKVCGTKMIDQFHQDLGLGSSLAKTVSSSSASASTLATGISNFNGMKEIYSPLMSVDVIKYTNTSSSTVQLNVKATSVSTTFRDSKSTNATPITVSTPLSTVNTISKSITTALHTPTKSTYNVASKTPTKNNKIIVPICTSAKTISLPCIFSKLLNNASTRLINQPQYTLAADKNNMNNKCCVSTTVTYSTVTSKQKMSNSGRTYNNTAISFPKILATSMDISTKKSLTHTNINTSHNNSEKTHIPLKNVISSTTLINNGNRHESNSYIQNMVSTATSNVQFKVTPQKSNKVTAINTIVASSIPTNYPSIPTVVSIIPAVVDKHIQSSNRMVSASTTIQDVSISSNYKYTQNITINDQQNHNMHQKNRPSSTLLYQLGHTQHSPKNTDAICSLENADNVTTDIQMPNQFVPLPLTSGQLDMPHVMWPTVTVPQTARQNFDIRNRFGQLPAYVNSHHPGHQYQSKMNPAPLFQQATRWPQQYRQILKQGQHSSFENLQHMRHLSRPELLKHLQILNQAHQNGGQLPVPLPYKSMSVSIHNISLGATNVASNTVNYLNNNNIKSPVLSNVSSRINQTTTSNYNPNVKTTEVTIKTTSSEDTVAASGIAAPILPISLVKALVHSQTVVTSAAFDKKGKTSVTEPQIVTANFNNIVSNVASTTSSQTNTISLDSINPVNTIIATTSHTIASLKPVTTLAVTQTTPSSKLSTYSAFDISNLVKVDSALMKNDLYCKHCERLFIHRRQYQFHLQTYCKQLKAQKEPVTQHRLNDKHVVDKTLKDSTNKINPESTTNHVRTCAVPTSTINSSKTKGALKSTKDITKSDTSKTLDLGVDRLESRSGVLKHTSVRAFDEKITTTKPIPTMKSSQIDFSITYPFDNEPLLPITGLDELLDSEHAFDVPFKDLLSLPVSNKETTASVSVSKTDALLYEDTSSFKDMNSIDHEMAVPKIKNVKSDNKNEFDKQISDDKNTKNRSTSQPLLSLIETHLQASVLLVNLDNPNYSVTCKLPDENDIDSITNDKKGSELSDSPLAANTLEDDVGSPASTVAYDLPEDTPYFDDEDFQKSDVLNVISTITDEECCFNSKEKKTKRKLSSKKTNKKKESFVTKTTKNQCGKHKTAKRLSKSFSEIDNSKVKNPVNKLARNKYKAKSKQKKILLLKEGDEGFNTEPLLDEIDHSLVLGKRKRKWPSLYSKDDNCKTEADSQAESETIQGSESRKTCDSSHTETNTKRRRKYKYFRGQAIKCENEKSKSTVLYKISTDEVIKPTIYNKNIKQKTTTKCFNNHKSQVPTGFCKESHLTKSEQLVNPRTVSNTKLIKPSNKYRNHENKLLNKMNEMNGRRISNSEVLFDIQATQIKDLQSNDAKPPESNHSNGSLNLSLANIQETCDDFNSIIDQLDFITEPGGAFIADTFTQNDQTPETKSKTKQPSVNSSIISNLTKQNLHLSSKVENRTNHRKNKTSTPRKTKRIDHSSDVNLAITNEKCLLTDMLATTNTIPPCSKSPPVTTKGSKEADMYFTELVAKLNNIENNPVTIAPTANVLSGFDQHDNEKSEKSKNLLTVKKLSPTNLIQIKTNSVTLKDTSKVLKDISAAKDHILRNKGTTITKYSTPHKTTKRVRSLSEDDQHQIFLDKSSLPPKPKYAWLFDDTFTMLSSTRKGKEFKSYSVDSSNIKHNSVNPKRLKTTASSLEKDNCEKGGIKKMKRSGSYLKEHEELAPVLASLTANLTNNSPLVSSDNSMTDLSSNQFNSYFPSLTSNTIDTNLNADQEITHTSDTFKEERPSSVLFPTQACTPVSSQATQAMDSPMETCISFDNTQNKIIEYQNHAMEFKKMKKYGPIEPNADSNLDIPLITYEMDELSPKRNKALIRDTTTLSSLNFDFENQVAIQTFPVHDDDQLGCNEHFFSSDLSSEDGNQVHLLNISRDFDSCHEDKVSSNNIQISSPCHRKRLNSEESAVCHGARRTRKSFNDHPCSAVARSFFLSAYDTKSVKITALKPMQDLNILMQKRGLNLLYRI